MNAVDYEKEYKVHKQRDEEENPGKYGVARGSNYARKRCGARKRWNGDSGAGLGGGFGGGWGGGSCDGGGGAGGDW